MPVVTLLAALLIAIFLSPIQSSADDPRQEPGFMQRTVTKTVESHYLLYLPDNYEKSKRKWPLLLFLHGSGSRGTELDSIKIDGPPRMIAEGHKFPFVVVSPLCPAGERWTKDVLVALLDEIVETHRVDEDRIYVTGLSMGGYGTWTLAEAVPDRLAAIVPICGGGNPDKADRIKNIPTWVFHGAKDPVVDLSRSTKMVNALYSVGADVRFTVYPEGGHVDAWRNAYADPALWSWLESQVRGRK